jgi:hypothetical protein
MTGGGRSTARQWSLWTVRVVTAAGLAIDAYVHWDLAPVYAEVRATIDEGLLFRVEAVVALLTAVAVIATGRRIAYLAALAVGASALAVMLVARYLDPGQLGPLPDLYDPTWFPEKLLAAFAEGAATAAAIAGAVMTGRALRTPRTVKVLRESWPRRGPKVTTGRNEQEEHRDDERIQHRRPAP